MLKASKAAKTLIDNCDDLICAVRENPTVLANIKIENIPTMPPRNTALQHIGIAGFVIAFAKALAVSGFK